MRGVYAPGTGEGVFPTCCAPAYAGEFLDLAIASVAYSKPKLFDRS